MSHAMRSIERVSLLAHRVARPATVFLCGVLPIVVVATLFVETMRADTVAYDFRVFYEAAEAMLRGDSPYPSVDDPAAAIGRSYVYPPLTAFLATPFTLLPEEAAGVLVMAVLVAVALGVLYVLGVRDWRCYGVLLLWPPILSAVQTGSVTLLLALAAALAWRYRAGTLASATSVGMTLAVKLILWPLAIWLAATRRAVAAALACIIGVGLVLVSWAAIGFAGLGDYPDLLRRLEDVVGEDSYTMYIVGLDLGASPTVARALWLGLGVALLASVVVLGRRGDEASAFVLAITAALTLTPIVWLHYFALLAVVVALAQPRLGVAWFLPLAMVLTPGSGHPSSFETGWTLAVAVLTVGLSLRATGGMSVRGSDALVHSATAEASG